MPQRFLVNLDLDQNQLLNALLQVLATDPGTPAEGQIWYRSDEGMPRFRTATATRRLAELVASGAVSVTYNGDGTVTVDVSKAAVDALGIDADTVDGSHAADLLARANHTGTQPQSTVDGLVGDLAAKLDDTQKGAANGLAELDTNVKLPVAQLPDVALGGLSYQGTWDATTNTPALDGTTPPEAGVFYKVGTAGKTNLSGITDWEIGDWAISDGTNWQKLDNTDQVASVAGKTGAVTLDLDELENVVNADLGGRLLWKATDGGDWAGYTPAEIGLSEDGHGHAIAEITDLQTELAGKMDTSGGTFTGAIHVEGTGVYVEGATFDHYLRTYLDAGAIYIQPSHGSITYGSDALSFDMTTREWSWGANALVTDDDARLSDARTPTAHTHAIGDVTNLQTELDGKSDTTHAHSLDDLSDVSNVGLGGHLLWKIDDTSDWQGITPEQLRLPRRRDVTLASAVGPYTFAHGLGDTMPTVTVYDDATGERVEVDVTVVDANNVALDWNGTHSLRVVAVA